jgi:hypothetical protein
MAMPPSGGDSSIVEPAFPAEKTDCHIGIIGKYSFRDISN